MNSKLTIQEKLQDLRKSRHLTLKQLEEQVGISSSTLGEYENNDYKDISSPLSGGAVSVLRSLSRLPTRYLRE